MEMQAVNISMDPVMYMYVIITVGWLVVTVCADCIMRKIDETFY